MKKAYQPIACNFHDVLLAKATLKERVRIAYLNQDDEKQDVKAIITDVFSKSGEEFLTTNAGLTIRLDQLISVGDERLVDYDSCKL